MTPEQIHQAEQAPQQQQTSSSSGTDTSGILDGALEVVGVVAEAVGDAIGGTAEVVGDIIGAILS